MVTKVFNFQPVLFHQYYLCRLLWFKKQSFTLVWKPNPTVCLVRHLRARADAVSVALPRKPRAESASLHVISEIWLLLQCAVALQRAGAADYAFAQVRPRQFFFYWGGGGGGVVRLTAKPRYLLLLHRGNKKSNTVTALLYSPRSFYSSALLLYTEFKRLRFVYVFESLLLNKAAFI